MGRIEQVNPKLNSVIHRLYDQASETATDWTSQIQAGTAGDAVFCGVPFVEGCRAVTGYVSKLDSELVRRQKASGLVIVGKTNTSEFGAMPTTEPLLYGPTVNPWNPSLTPAGASGGSAAAVAARVVPMAHGNDGGGSIRTPASCCGIFGLEPSRGRNPLGPLCGDIGSGIVQEQGLTLTVRDSAALLDATSGPDIGDPYFAPPKERLFLEEVARDVGCLRIGFLNAVPEGWQDIAEFAPDCADALRDAAQLCDGLGHNVEEISPSALSHPGIADAFRCVFNCYIGQAVAYWERELGARLSNA